MKRALIVLTALAATGCTAQAADVCPPDPTGTPTVSESPTPTPTEPPAPAKKIIGMSSPASLWAQRLSEVGACGVEARRIFADLTSTGRDQSTLIGQAVAQGMLPVISWKVPNVNTLIAGGYDTWLTNLRTYLMSLGVPVAATFWHEPYPDITGAQFVAGSQRFFDRVNAPSIAVGPIMNGFLLDRRVPDFAAYTSPTLLNEWEWFGADSYQSGSETNPGDLMPARAVPLLTDWLADQGHADMQVAIPEYNGYSATALTTAGETLLSTPQVWFGMVFNSNTGGKGITLTGPRLAAFKATKADPRALHDPAC